jgi:membrane associated rhomboid family serine protease
MTFFGDEIAIADWKEKLHEYHEQLQMRTSSIFGLKTQAGSPLTWVTYQFMHASWMHLFGNMAMLLIFGAALESAVGGMGLIFIYLLSGFAGAWAFLLLGQNTLAPMIGASGALSGVMAFYAAYEKKRRVSFFYFVSPMPGYYGWIYLPTLAIFPLCFLSDFAGYLSTPTEIGTGVAYTAHIGGAVFGTFFGFALRHFRRTLWVRWISQH